MNTLRFLLPFSYFLGSRLTSIKDFVFHFYYEWLANILILIFVADRSISSSIVNFLLGYLAFISIYEIGYFANDIYSVRHEANPRKRVLSFNPANFEICLWIMFRLAVFVSISWWLRPYINYNWWAFYFLLAVFFTLHNWIKEKQYKIFTFFGLATLRFFGPVFIFLGPEKSMVVMPTVIFCYVFFRTLTYMDSKNLLNLPDRQSTGFRIYYYSFCLLLSLWISFQFNSYVPTFIALYYLIFVVASGLYSRYNP